MSSSFINVGDKTVILVDCSNKTPEHFDEIIAKLEEARSLMTGAPENSVYIITDLTKSKFSPALVDAFSNFAAANTRYIKESILVGLSDHHIVIMSIIKRLHKRDFHIADTLDDAEKHLLSIL